MSIFLFSSCDADLVKPNVNIDYLAYYSVIIESECGKVETQNEYCISFTTFTEKDLASIQVCSEITFQDLAGNERTGFYNSYKNTFNKEELNCN